MKVARVKWYFPHLPLMKLRWSVQQLCLSLSSTNLLQRWACTEYQPHPIGLTPWSMIVKFNGLKLILYWIFDPMETTGLATKWGEYQFMGLVIMREVGIGERVKLLIDGPFVRKIRWSSPSFFGGWSSSMCFCGFLNQNTSPFSKHISFLHLFIIMDPSCTNQVINTRNFHELALQFDTQFNQW